MADEKIVKTNIRYKDIKIIINDGIITNKECRKCHRILNLDEYRNTNDGYLKKRSICKRCEREYAKNNRPEPILLKEIYVDGILEKKECSKCHKTIDIKFFRYSKLGKNGLRSHCKSCDKIYDKKWKDKNAQYFTKYRAKYTKLYYQKNKERIKESVAEYNKQNKRKRKQYIKQWAKNKRDNDKLYKLQTNMGALFRSNLQRRNVSKNRSVFEYTGLKYKEYFDYFLEQQSCELSIYLSKDRSLHIDHIIPCSLYDFTNLNDIKKCWNPKNLRIIDKYSNMKKFNILDLKLIKKHKIMHLLPEGYNYG